MHLFHQHILAEVKRFELLRRQSRPTGFRIRTLQPLGYTSIYREPLPQCTSQPCQSPERQTAPDPTGFRAGRGRRNEFSSTLVGVMTQGQCTCCAGDKRKAPGGNPFPLSPNYFVSSHLPQGGSTKGKVEPGITNWNWESGKRIITGSDPIFKM